jgi:hypothetical protein
MRLYRIYVNECRDATCAGVKRYIVQRSVHPHTCSRRRDLRCVTSVITSVYGETPDIQFSIFNFPGGAWPLPASIACGITVMIRAPRL